MPLHFQRNIDESGVGSGPSDDESSGFSNDRYGLLCSRPMSVHSPFCPYAGVWREDPRGVHDSPAAAAEDEEGLDAHGPQTLGALRSRYGEDVTIAMTFLLLGSFAMDLAIFRSRGPRLKSEDG